MWLHLISLFIMQCNVPVTNIVMALPNGVNISTHPAALLWVFLQFIWLHVLCIFNNLDVFPLSLFYLVRPPPLLMPYGTVGPDAVKNLIIVDLDDFLILLLEKYLSIMLDCNWFHFLFSMVAR